MNRLRKILFGSVRGSFMLCAAFLCFFFMLCGAFGGAFGGVAKADMGPKPSITLKVVNGPADYYVALLAHSDATGWPDSREEIGGETVWNIITSYQVDGWFGGSLW